MQPVLHSGEGLCLLKPCFLMSSTQKSWCVWESKGNKLHIHRWERSLWEWAENSRGWMLCRVPVIFWTGLDGSWTNCKVHQPSGLLLHHLSPLPTTQSWHAHRQCAAHEVAEDLPYSGNFTSVDGIAASSFLQTINLLLVPVPPGLTLNYCRVKGWERVRVQQAEECARWLAKFTNSKAPGLHRLYLPPEVCSLSDTPVT